MIFSICIPIFNQQPEELVNSLLDQKVDSDFEILLFDDGSTDPNVKEKNSKYFERKGINYYELPKNVGRATIRNKMAEVAKGEYLIFLDGDSLIPEANYLQNYRNLLNTNTTVICGGRHYQGSTPSAEYSLHWKYGRLKESTSARERQQKPHQGFHSNNFLINKQLFLDIQFDSSLKTYGHEDTLFGYELKKRGIPVLHTDNPVEHGGLEKTEIFLNKSIHALRNLSALMDKHQDGLVSMVALLRTYSKIRGLGLCPLFSWIHRRFVGSMARRLNTKDPSLVLFNIYKLTYFCFLRSTSQKGF